MVTTMLPPRTFTFTLAVGLSLASCFISPKDYPLEVEPAGLGGGAGRDAMGGAASVGGKRASPAGGAGAATGGSEPADAGAPSSGAGAEAGSPVGTEGGSGSGGSAGNSTSGGTAGTSGIGGSGSELCADHPLSPRSTWIASASTFSSGNGMESDALYNPPSHLIDGSYSERWASGKTQSGDEWIQIDFGLTVAVSAITLNVSVDTGDYPRAYAIRLSNKAQDFAASILASGQGSPGNTVIQLAQPATGRYMTVRQTGVNNQNTGWWTIAEVLISCTN
jgi:hypothetical protein